MAYAVAMETLAAFPSDIGDRTPPEAQASIRSLEARLSALESMVQALQEQNRALQEQRNQTSRNFRVEPQVTRTAPPQVRTSAINTSGSSVSRFRCIDGVNDPGRRESVPL